MSGKSIVLTCSKLSTINFDLPKVSKMTINFDLPERVIWDNAYREQGKP